MTQTDVVPDVFDHRYMQDPHPMMALMREEQPVRQVMTPNGLKVWLVTRYDDVRAALADPRVSKNMLDTDDIVERNLTQPEKRREFAKEIMQYMLNTDPPQHTRLRALVSKTFTNRRVEAMRPAIERNTAELLDAFPATGEVDLIQQLAFPLPIMVICQLLGVPLEDKEDLRNWIDMLVTTSRPGDAKVAGEAMVGYLGNLLAAKRAEPTDDILSALIHATDQDKLTEAELISMTFLLLFAGYETTVHTVGNGALALLVNPEQRELLRRQPSLMSGAVDEFLRFNSPVSTATFRFTTEPVTLSGTTIPAREFVLLSLLSANRDATRFPDPDQLDVARSTTGHLGFGHGVHYCLGASLGRMEVEIALSSLLRRFPNLRLAVPPEELVWRESLLMHGLDRLPVLL
ncbi:MAG TPA: cytochrome P450 [Pilimelia sp.]|nr:cytochrome P450 [Pilimelia sp.]